MTSVYIICEQSQHINYSLNFFSVNFAHVFVPKSLNERKEREGGKHGKVGKILKRRMEAHQQGW
jgi:hypothetical protein